MWVSTGVLLLGAVVIGVGLYTNTKHAAAQSVQPAAPIVGRWKDPQGTVYEISTAGTKIFTGKLLSNPAGVCAPVNLQLSGSGAHYSGTEAFYATPCKPPLKFLGAAVVTVDVSPDGQTAQVARTPPAGQPCKDCTTATWTRKNS